MDGGPIGTCIRRLTVATNPDLLKCLHEVELSEEFNAHEDSVKTKRLDRASKAY